MKWLLFLHLEIDRRVMYPWQWRYWQIVQQYMQDANLNSGTSIFKNRILAQFVTHDFFLDNPMSHEYRYHFKSQKHIEH